ncbi:FKBP-type peptidyl-prolyl cis-trans isomerase [Actinophytocola gossypii]|uniref:Peptidyl-prolyl cis-trans isomerase n=1 Tax=Actinophytocola gossypii TaxID=2812003 RepID=A0ABT2J5Z7_9PSEU|nr:FKBP-type peptidyl-prolyl cis-trans isomerase [Actinophytocola gossypii]MCT2583290.1 FKBP-type peptidyl-prolyl cis-trans isomerase [Actinophytocola gossypii]
MRNVSKILVVVAAAALTVTGCVSQDQASDEPPGDTQTFSEPAAPERSADPDAPECTAADIQVEGAPGEKPTVTLPEDCSAPTELIVEDLAPGDGPEAAEGGAMQAHYALTAWSTGEEVEASYGQSPLPIDSIGVGMIEAWNQGLVGMRQGGRRLIVAPPDMAYAGSGNELQDETLVFVVDAVEITAP